MKRNHVLRKNLVGGIILMFVVTCIIPAVAQNTMKPMPALKGHWLYVGGSGPGNYTKIQDAINTASDGDTVYVYNDSSPYLEDLVITKSLLLLGEDEATTIIQGTTSHFNIQVKADDVTISGFTCQENWYSMGIIIYGNNSRIMGNTIKNTSLSISETYQSSGNFIAHNTIIQNGYGLKLYSSNTTFEANTVQGGDSTSLEVRASSVRIANNSLTGIEIDGSHNVIVSNNTIAPGYGPMSPGIRFYAPACSGLSFLGNRLLGCGFEFFDYPPIPPTMTLTFINNSVNGRPFVFLREERGTVIEDAGQVVLLNCSHITIRNSTIHDVNYGIVLIGTTASIIEGNIISSHDTGLTLIQSSRNTIQNNSINASEGIYILIGYGNVIRKNSIQNALDGISLSSLFFDFSSNQIIHCDLGMYCQFAILGKIRYNTIKDCEEGIYLEASLGMRIVSNTFLNTTYEAEFITSFFNHWRHNYWNQPRVLPKVIHGKVVIPLGFYYAITIPWVKIDWRPAQEPYDIPRMKS